MCYHDHDHQHHVDHDDNVHDHEHHDNDCGLNRRPEKENMMKKQLLTLVAAVAIGTAFLVSTSESQTVPPANGVVNTINRVGKFPNITAAGMTATVTYTNSVLTIDPTDGITVWITLTNCPGSGTTWQPAFDLSPDNVLFTTNQTFGLQPIVPAAIAFKAADSGKELTTNFFVSASTLGHSSVIRCYASKAAGGGTVYIKEIKLSAPAQR